MKILSITKYLQENSIIANAYLQQPKLSLSERLEMNNSAYILHTMGLAFKEMGKPKADIVRHSAQLEGGLTIFKSAEIDRFDAMRTKRRAGKNQIFDTDSIVPDNLKKPKIVRDKVTPIQRAASTLGKRGSAVRKLKTA